jgi:flagellar hook-basal body complex protein FliE
MQGINGVGGAARIGPIERPFEAQTGGISFADTLARAVNGVTELQDGARDIIGAFLRGEHVELHEVMAATEEAGLALEMLVEMRNKLTEAYRTIINMQT